MDTGSKDNSPQLAEKLGAKVFHFPWCDDFAAARNESLRHASGHWILWMDADDTIDAANGQKLQALACGSYDERLMGFVMQVHCPAVLSRYRDQAIIDGAVGLRLGKLGPP